MTDTPQTPAAAATPHPLSSPPRRNKLADNLRAALKHKALTNLDDILVSQALTLDTLFKHLVLNDASSPHFDEAFGLALALRAQKQCRTTVETVQTLRRRREGQGTP